VINNQELQRRCRLMEPLDLLSCRRISFITKVTQRPSCEMARQVFFAEITHRLGRPPKRVSGRERSSYLAVLDLDLRYLYSGALMGQSLSKILALGWSEGPPFVKKMLKALKPDRLRGGSLKLVSARERNLRCPVEGCTGQFAEQKEVNRHVRTKHAVMASDTRPPVSDVVSVRNNESDRPTRSCTLCSAVFKTEGWLKRHINSNHAELAVSANSNTRPPTVRLTVVEAGPPPSPLAVRGTRHRRVPVEQGRGPLLVVGPGLGPAENNPVQLVGDNEYGQIGRRSLRRRPQLQGEA
jgi:uncharacterized C2H2 Zn-finger protein